MVEFHVCNSDDGVTPNFYFMIGGSLIANHVTQIYLALFLVLTVNVSLKVFFYKL